MIIVNAAHKTQVQNGTICVRMVHMTFVIHDILEFGDTDLTVHGASFGLGFMLKEKPGRCLNEHEHVR